MNFFRIVVRNKFGNISIVYLEEIFKKLNICYFKNLENILIDICIIFVMYCRCVML